MLFCEIGGTPKKNLPTRQQKVLPHFFINVTLLCGAKRLKMYRTRERERERERERVGRGTNF